VTGTLALLGGGEFGEALRALDRELLERAGTGPVVVLPSAAAFEQPDRVIETARAHFAALGAEIEPLRVLRRHEATKAVAAQVRETRFVYVTDGSPLHLRSVLKGSPLFDAIVEMYEDGGVVAAAGASATVMGDPMVDPRGGAYTVGLGLVANLAVFPYHGTAADHLRERSLDLLHDTATLVGIDEQAAAVRDPDGTWRAAGVGTVSRYEGRSPVVYESGAVIDGLP
jgi:cyanophycinase